MRYFLASISFKREVSNLEFPSASSIKKLLVTIMVCLLIPAITPKKSLSFAAVNDDVGASKIKG